MEVYKSTHTSDAFNFALSAVPSIGENGNWFIGGVDTGISATGGINIADAKVGQTVKIVAVDEKGAPTAWEAADMNGTMPLLADVTMEEAVGGFDVALSIPAKRTVIMYVELPADCEVGTPYGMLNGSLVDMLVCRIKTGGKTWYQVDLLEGGLTRWQWADEGQTGLWDEVGKAIYGKAAFYSRDQLTEIASIGITHLGSGTAFASETRVRIWGW